MNKAIITLVLTLFTVFATASEEQFFSVTAKNGAQWTEQCEKPAIKSSPERRISACLSYINGALLLAKEWRGKPICIKDHDVVLGAIHDVTIHAAKQFPEMSVEDIFGLSLSAVYKCKGQTCASGRCS